MKDAWRHFVSEFLGTYALVFFGGAAIIGAYAMGNPASLTQVAFAHGLILAVVVTATMRISGHLNPAVTLGFLVVRRIDAMMAAVYWVAQFLGAVLAAYALRSLLPDAAVAATRIGGQIIAGDVTLGQAVGLEAVATFFLMFVIFGSAVDERAPRVGGFAIGLTVAAAVFAIGPFTGASLNPARSFGPALASGIFEGQTAFWIGPILGAIAAAVLYDRLFLRRPVEPADHGAVRPTR